MDSSRMPLARKDGLVVQDVQDEVLVYDLNSHKAHALNRPAGLIWRHCDGKNSVADIRSLLKNELGSSLSDDFVWLAIDQLIDNDLLETSSIPNKNVFNRREVIRKIGMTTVVALPLVASLVAPSSVFASASCSCTAGNPVPCLTTNCPNPVNCNGAGICAP